MDVKFGFIYGNCWTRKHAKLWVQQEWFLKKYRWFSSLQWQSSYSRCEAVNLKVKGHSMGDIEIISLCSVHSAKIARRYYQQNKRWAKTVKRYLSVLQTHRKNVYSFLKFVFNNEPNDHYTYTAYNDKQFECDLSSETWLYTKDRISNSNVQCTKRTTLITTFRKICSLCSLKKVNIDHLPHWTGVNEQFPVNHTVNRKTGL